MGVFASTSWVAVGTAGQTAGNQGNAFWLSILFFRHKDTKTRRKTIFSR
jgi:hypothetical protein